MRKFRIGNIIGGWGSPLLHVCASPGFDTVSVMPGSGSTEGGLKDEGFCPSVTKEGGVVGRLFVNSSSGTSLPLYSFQVQVGSILDLSSTLPAGVLQNTE